MAPFGLLGSSSSVGDFSAAWSLFVVENWSLFYLPHISNLRLPIPN